LDFWVVDKEIFQRQAAFAALKRTTATPACDFVGDCRIGSDPNDAVLGIAIRHMSAN
jgi:hypothetical protein